MEAALFTQFQNIAEGRAYVRGHLRGLQGLQGFGLGGPVR